MATTASDVENDPKKGNNGDGTETNKPSFWDNYGNQIISGGSTLLGSALGAVSNIIANNQQKKMMQMQNEFNRSERIAAQDWELDMWNKQNAYNTPLAQKQRLLEAGFNPYNLGVDNGNSSNMPSTSGASGSNVPSQHVYDPSHAFTAFADNMYKDSLMRSQSLNLQADTEKKQAETTNIMLDNKLFNDTYAFKVKAQELGVDQIIKQNLNLEQSYKESVAREGLTKAKETYQLLSNEEKRTLNKYLEPQLQVGLLQSLAELNNLYLKGKLTEWDMKLRRAQICEAYASASEHNANAEGKRELNRFIKNTVDSKIQLVNMQNTVDSMKAQIDGHYFPQYGAKIMLNNYKHGVEKSQREYIDAWGRNNAFSSSAHVAGEFLRDIWFF